MSLPYIAYKNGDKDSPCMSPIEVNMITHLGVLALFYIKLKKNNNTFRLIFQKL
jgi:hypothetical protein